MSSVHEHRLRIRYGETDQMGRAHHANYLLYLEEARTRMMASRGWSYADLERQGIGLPVRRSKLRYRAGIGYDEELLVRTHVASHRAASITFAYELVRAEDGTRVAEGTIELACVDLTAEPAKPRPLPEGLLAALEAGSGDPAD